MCIRIIEEYDHERFRFDIVLLQHNAYSALSCVMILRLCRNDSGVC